MSGSSPDPETDLALRDVDSGLLGERHAMLAHTSCLDYPSGDPVDNSCTRELIDTVLENRLQLFRQILREHPIVIERSQQTIMIAVAVAEDICTEAFLEIISSQLASMNCDWTLNQPIDSDANRVTHWSALYGNVPKLETFERFGADLRLANRLGTTPLFDAVRGGSPDAIESIVRASGSDALRHFNRYDCSPMHWACKQASFPGVQTLHEIDHELINLPNRRGGYPLDVLEWRRLYHVDLAKRRLGRALTEHEIRPYDQICEWMKERGAKSSPQWSSLSKNKILNRKNSPINAELWWNYVERPRTW